MSKHTDTKRGPYKKPNGHRRTRVDTYLTPDEAAQLAKAVAETNLTRAEYIRRRFLPTN